MSDFIVQQQGSGVPDRNLWLLVGSGSYWRFLLRKHRAAGVHHQPDGKGKRAWVSLPAKRSTYINPHWQGAGAFHRLCSNLHQIFKPLQRRQLHRRLPTRSKIYIRHFYRQQERMKFMANITYRQVNDYMVPNLTLPPEESAIRLGNGAWCIRTTYKNTTPSSSQLSWLKANSTNTAPKSTNRQMRCLILSLSSWRKEKVLAKNLRSKTKWNGLFEWIIFVKE